MNQLVNILRGRPGIERRTSLTKGVRPRRWRALNVAKQKSLEREMFGDFCATLARAAGFEPVISAVHGIHPFGVAWTISSPYLIKGSGASVSSLYAAPRQSEG